MSTAPPNDRFTQLAAAFYARGTGPVTQDDRRSAPRTPATKRIPALIRRAGTDIIHAVLRDLSRGGAGLTAATAMRRGEECTLDVNLGRGVVRLKCRICSCRLSPDNHYFLGAQFLTVERPSADQAQETHQFLSPADISPIDVDRAHLSTIEKQLAAPPANDTPPAPPLP